jgi:hypothetical protein
MHFSNDNWHMLQKLPAALHNTCEHQKGGEVKAMYVRVWPSCEVPSTLYAFEHPTIIHQLLPVVANCIRSEEQHM